MRKIIFTITLLTLFPVLMFAGNDFIPGYIITTKGDTLKGLLLVQKSLEATKSCKFKYKIDSETVIYKPNEILGYRYVNNGKYYVSKTLPKRLGQVSENVFMEYFVKGITSIYYMVDKNGEHFYIEKKPQGLIELSESERITDDRMVLPKIYKGKLKSIMSDCPSMDKEINSTKLEYTSLVKLAKDYQNKVCSSDSCIVFERKATKVYFKYGLIAGMSINKYFIGDGISTDLNLGYQLGFTTKIKNALFADENVDLNIDLVFGYESSYTFNGIKNQVYYVDYKGTTYPLTNIKSVSIPGLVNSMPVDVQFIDLRIPFTIGYNFNFGPIVLDPAVGLTNRFLIKNNQEFKIRDFQDQYGRTFNPYSVGLIAKVGFTSRKQHNVLGANVVYEYMLDPAAVNQFLRIIHSSFSFQLTYLF